MEEWTRSKMLKHIFQPHLDDHCQRGCAWDGSKSFAAIRWWAEVASGMFLIRLRSLLAHRWDTMNIVKATLMPILNDNIATADDSEHNNVHQRQQILIKDNNDTDQTKRDQISARTERLIGSSPLCAILECHGMRGSRKELQVSAT